MARTIPHHGGILRLPALLSVLLAILAVMAQSAEASTGRAAVTPRLFTNPVLGPGQDPSLATFHHSYFLVQATYNQSAITVRTSRSIKTLARAAKQVVWAGGEAGSPCCQWWAPELHRLDGRWFIYATADSGTTPGHRLQVLRSESSSPLGPYAYLGQLTTPGNFWSIDPSPIELPDGRLFMFWSGWPGVPNGVQNIYMSAMLNPARIVGPRIQLSTPRYVWERHPNPGPGPVYVNESPEPIIHGNTLSVTYSGSGCYTPDYALGLVYAPLDSDLLNPASWTKSPVPILQSNPASGIYGPGSNGWFMSPGGKQTWIAFNAVTDPAGNCGNKRRVYVQPVHWNANGTPNLGGAPLPSSQPLAVPLGDPGI